MISGGQIFMKLHFLSFSKIVQIVHTINDRKLFVKLDGTTNSVSHERYIEDWIDR